ncbi:MAG TPA: hypothetical protein DCK95_08480 [Anaerolineaceae bacterium]|nr:hypothetical protein [Anaerolineaceae bacterium]
MKYFERFIQYLCVMGVIIAIFYQIFPDLTNTIINNYSTIIGPILVVGLFALAVFRKPKEKKDQAH